jgi:N-methylhydantoinase B
VTNDPYTGGGTHLSDVSMVMPIFFEGQVMGFAANKAHWTEVGGKDPGSWTTDSVEVFQEGLQLPNVKLFSRGQPIQSVIDIVEANVRLPDMTLGDLYAQAASARLGARRVADVCRKYGWGTVEAAIGHLLAHGEEIVRGEMARLPKGVFEAEDWIDDDGLGSEPIPVKVKVTITEDEFICDFTGTGPQAKGPINCSWTSVYSGLRAIFRAITEPRIPPNEGCFRPIRAICPEGTVFTAKRPAPVSTYWDTMLFVTELVWKALAPHIPDRLAAAHFLSVCADVTATIHPDTGELALLVEPNAGGWGASEGQDGADGLVCVGDGETYILPVEVTETVYGIQVDQYAYHITEGGEGKYRGGRGLVRDYRMLSDTGGTFTGTFGRHKFPVWGVHGGRPGSRNLIEVIRADGEIAARFGKCARYPLEKGDVVRLITATGGGWGDPAERPRALVEADLRAGMITPEIAATYYGYRAGE